jgi:hypothetical protein
VLAKKLDIQCLDTVRALAKRIRAALAEEDASDLLAGLDVYFSRNAT